MAKERYDGTPRLYAMLLEYDTLERPLDEARSDARGDLVGIPEISFELFKSGVLPTLRSKFRDVRKDVEVVYKACVDKGVIVNDRFVHFKASPTKIKEESKLGVLTEDAISEEFTKVTEDTIYANMQSLWEKVVDIAKVKLGLNPSVEFKHTPNAHPYMERGEATRPDAMSLVIESKMPDKFAEDSKYYFCNYALLKEDKVGDKPEDREDNISKILLNTNINFANDPLRRGLYSLTSEDDKLRVWLFCKSGGVVSKPINWIKQVKEVIGIILRLSFADHTELGFDETITRYWIHSKGPNNRPIYDKNLQYKIPIGGRKFRTVGEPIYDRRANFFAGQGTRVFAVIEMDKQESDYTNGKPNIALKVSWPRESDNSPREVLREAAAIRLLRKKAKQLGIDDSWLPVVLADSDALIATIDEEGNQKTVSDKTKLFVRHDLSAVSTQFYPGPTMKNKPRIGTNSIRGSARAHSYGGIPAEARTVSVTGLSDDGYVNPDVDDFIRIRWVNRVQYRMAFDGIGSTIAQLESLHKVFLAFRNGVRAVRNLHRCGYIHRDISINNILMFENHFDGLPWLMKLNDYEYIRPIDEFYDDETILTGTRQFMALEILRGRYLHYNAKAANRARADSDDDEELLIRTGKSSEWDFHSNALHDLEPFFWMSLWVLFYRVPKKPKNPIEPQQLGRQLDTGYNIFFDGSKQKRGQPSTIRSECLNAGAETLTECLKDIPQDYKNIELDRCMVRLARHVVRCYEELEGSPNFCGASSAELLTMPPDWVYNGFEKIFNACLEELDKKDILIADAKR